MEKKRKEIIDSLKIHSNDVGSSEVQIGLLSEKINNLNARLIRERKVLYTGAINRIFREKNAAKQVAAGIEFGITLKDFTDFKEKDVIEVYKIVETERRI